MGLHHPSDPTLTAPWAGDTLGTWNMNSSYPTGPLVHHGQGATPKSMDIVDVQLESASLTTPSPSQPACHLQEPQGPMPQTPPRNPSPDCSLTETTSSRIPDVPGPPGYSEGGRGWYFLADQVSGSGLEFPPADRDWKI